MPGDRHQSVFVRTEGGKGVRKEKPMGRIVLVTVMQFISTEGKAIFNENKLIENVRILRIILFAVVYYPAREHLGITNES